MTIRRVVKVSGHLIKDLEALRALIELALSVVRSEGEVALVPGGSVFADAVAEAQRLYGLSDRAAHWMAVKAMEVYGALMESLSAYVVSAETAEEVNRAWSRRMLPVVYPYKLIKEFEWLPESWAVTSDSISVLVAYKLGCDVAVLAKIVDGIMEGDKLLAKVRAEHLKRLNQSVVDSFLPEAVERLGVRVAVVNAYRLDVLRCLLMSGDPELCGGFTLIEP